MSFDTKRNLFGDGEVTVPEGGGEFTPTGLVGPWIAQMQYTLYSNSIGPEIASGDGLQFADVVQLGGYWYYFAEYNTGVKFAEHYDMRGNFGLQKPQQRWRFIANRDSLLNLYKPENWSNPLSFDGDVKGLGSPARYKYQLIMLPSAVAAVARLYGKDVEFDLSELLDQSMLYDDKFFAEFVGHPDAKAKEAQQCQELVAYYRERGESNPMAKARSMIVGVAYHGQEPDGVPDELLDLVNSGRVHWTISTLYERRAKLWQALGENDPDAFQMKGATTPSDKESRFATTSDELDTCLEVTRPWPEALWIRLLNVSDPKPGAVNSSGRQYTIPTIAEMFTNEAAARAAVEAESGDDEAVGSSEPALPAAWPAKYKDDFVALVRTVKAEVGDNPAPPILAGAIERNQLTCTVEEYLAWSKVV